LLVDVPANKDSQSIWRPLINSSSEYLLVKAQNFRLYFPATRLNSCADCTEKGEWTHAIIKAQNWKTKPSMPRFGIKL
ncbi:MAG: hypothetical protein Q7T89_11725, partial [Anaerolineales bacterium]|nr:hypothetical protein [Anaerolineales bacterium]